MESDMERGRLAAVVEDDWEVRLAIATAFAEEGWHVLELTTGELALELLDSSREVDLLVTDTELSGRITGWDVAERYRQANSQIAVIYSSRNPPNEERRVSDSVFLGMPYVVTDLIKAAETLVTIGRTIPS